MSPERESRQEVSLRRLCAVARLGPGPAVAVARAVLGRLTALHLRGQVHGAVTGDAVLIGDDGEVRLAGEGARPALAPAAIAGLQQDDVAAAWELVAALLEASPVTVPAGLRTLLDGPPPRDGAHAGLAAVSAAAGELTSVSGERRAAARLSELAAPLRRYRHGPPQLTAGALGAATVITAPPVAATPPAAVRGRRRPALIAVTGLAVAAALGTGLLVTRGSTSPTPPSTAAPTASPATTLPAAPPPPPIPDPPVLAPASAGTVAAVRLIPTAGPCLPATVCALQVRVELLPHHPATMLRLVLRLVDRCTGVGSEVALAPLSVTAAAATQISVRVRVPAGPAPAIIAVVTSPARAASPPLLVAPYLPFC